MNLKGYLALVIVFVLSSATQAGTFKNDFNEFKIDGFTDSEISSLFMKLTPSQKKSKLYLEYLSHAAQTPYAPLGSHAGKKFYEALSWYNDIVLGNKNGKFHIYEKKPI